MSEKNFLKSFEAHGIEFYSEDSGDGFNFIADCPFSGKEKKFYVNKDTGQWDSKASGMSGNLYSFLRNFYRWCQENTELSDLLGLAEAKSLPIEAFQENISKNPINGEYVIPEYNMEGKLTGLGKYRPTSKAVYRTKYTKVQLNHGHKISKNAQVFVVEGEWDFFALSHIFKVMGKDHVVVIAPGAGTFKPEWQECFRDCKVTLCYDNDESGQKGLVKAWDLLSFVAEEVKRVEWEEVRKNGFDIRDLVVEICKGKAAKGSIKKAYMKLMSLLTTKAPTTSKKGRESEFQKEEDENDGLPLPTPQEVEQVIGKWLKMTSNLPIDIMLGTIFANRIEGDPVWTFLVAPPGGSKTELLMTLNMCAEIETTTTLTSAALISGIKFAEGEDPSLLVKIDGRMLVIKDFTTILTMNPNARDEVFGVLRDAYDGYVEKFFGTGIKKSYKSKFGILAGVTPAVDALAAKNSSLGERFLKFRLDRFESPESEEEKIMKALSNVGQENGMREEMQRMIKRMMKKKIPETLPVIRDIYLKKIMACAILTAYLRGSVVKDPYTGEMLCMPVREVGTRLAKQISKLGVGICIYKDKTEFDEEIMTAITMVALDTCPDRIANLVGQLRKATKGDSKASVTTKDLVSYTNMGDSTVSRVIEDLKVLNIVHKVDGKMGDMKTHYRLTKKIEDLCNQSGMFEI
tara:strand:- start:195 stop:2255 length:2061 start_codon:yes stop_codon:yes gene_type:complete